MDLPEFIIRQLKWARKHGLLEDRPVIAWWIEQIELLAKRAPKPECHEPAHTH